MVKYDFAFVLLHISAVLTVVLAWFMFKHKQKKQIHYAFISLLILQIFWEFGTLLEQYIRDIYGFTWIPAINICYIGICFVPISLLFFSIIFAHTKIDFNWKYILPFVVPVITTAVVWTNDYHHLFFVHFSTSSKEAVYGSYFMFHAVYSYACVLIALGYLTYFSIKNSGFFSKQSTLIVIGSIVPLVVNILYTYNVLPLPFLCTAVAFFVLTMCFAFATFKFNFMSVVPVALQKVVDRMSDSFLVIDEEFRIIDFNKTFVDTFQNIVQTKRKTNIIETLKDSHFLGDTDCETFEQILNKTNKSGKPFKFEQHIVKDNFDKYFDIEIAPIGSGNSHIATIILLKDITQHTNDMQQLKDYQNILLQRERLVSLGEAAGNVAHDINNPISAVAYGLSAIDDVLKCIKQSENITKEQIELLNMAEEALANNTTACQRALTIVSSLRNGTRNLDSEFIEDFHLSRIFEDVQSILGYRFKQSSCALKISAYKDVLIRGDASKLYRVVSNVVANALDAYGDKSGDIEINVHFDGNYGIIISIKDCAGGIPEKIRSTIFKKMITSKSLAGTGLGLFMSKSLITGHYGGDLRFEVNEGIGTTFYINIPFYKENNQSCGGVING